MNRISINAKATLYKTYHIALIERWLRISLLIAISLLAPSSWQTLRAEVDTTPIDNHEKLSDAAAESARGLLKRLLPKHVASFAFVSIPRDENRDVFEIETQDGKVCIRGNSGTSMAMGLNWYLKQYCHCHVSLCGSQLNLPEELPQLQNKVRRVSWARHRYFLNYCCFGYSLAWWDWPQWERLIDWMALNGVNMPLAVTGQEAVWQAVCLKLGLTDKQISEFLAGPPYLPFGWMGCLDGWGGPLPQSWIDGHVELQRKILARQRQFGMTPVLQGFTGHVPSAIGKKFPNAKLHKINWFEWHTNLLDPLDPLFAKIAKLFMDEQIKQYGTDHLYAADTFIEMVPPSNELKYLDSLGRAIYSGMAQSDSQAIWVKQGWTFMYKRSFWTPQCVKAFLDAVPNKQMIVLDLWCEKKPMWPHTEAFYGKPWLWCSVQNWGGRVYLGGALNTLSRSLMTARNDPKSGQLTGMGFANEGLGYNPIVYDLMFEMAWRNKPVDMDHWIENYTHHRYGQSNKNAKCAWKILQRTAYNEDKNSARSIVDMAPTIGPLCGLSRSSNDTPLYAAWWYLLQCSDELENIDTYCFDLVNVARQVLVNHGVKLHGNMRNAYLAKDINRFEAESEMFVKLLGDLDELLATREEFLLGRWLDNSKRWGSNDIERTKFEWNARRAITIWGSGCNTGIPLRDYARKEWSGMINGFYMKRWEWYLKEVAKSLKTDKPLPKDFDQKLLKWEVSWADLHDQYPTEPCGNSIAVTKTLWKKYCNSFAESQARECVKKVEDRE